MAEQTVIVQGLGVVGAGIDILLIMIFLVLVGIWAKLGGRRG